jgi:hypothetical protein
MNIIYKFCGVSATQYAADDRKNGRQGIGKNGTQRTSALVSTCATFLGQNTKSHRCGTRHILPTLHRVFFFFIFQKETRFEREKL